MSGGRDATACRSGTPHRCPPSLKSPSNRTSRPLDHTRYDLEPPGVDTRRQLYPAVQYQLMFADRVVTEIRRLVCQA
jgi:hypothetical protein